MALLDFMKDRNAAQQPSASQQQSAAQTQQQESPAQRSVQSLPDNVKAQAVEAARPAAELMDKATTPRTGESQPSMQNTPDNTQARGRSLSMER
jgi:hypothetical protein